MRNLKRALSLALATVMTLGLMVVGTGAVGYDDVADTDNVEAIEVLQAVGIMTGDENGNFNPDNTVTRNEMAVIMSQLLNLNYDYYRGTNPFSDVPSWAAPYVAACAAEGVTSGVGGGLYNGDGNVTAAQAALMLMKALGYFQYQDDFDDDWQVATIRQASYIRLFDGIDASAETALTRNQIAQLVLNALKANMVEFTGDVGNKITVGDTTLTSGYRPEYSYRTNAASQYNTIDVGTTNIAENDQYYIQLGEELYDGDLRLQDSSDVFGRPARYWEYDGDEIGTYVKNELIRHEYTEKVTGKDLYDLLGKSTIEDYEIAVYIDGETDSDVLNDAYFNEGNLIRTNTETVGSTGNGVLTQVFVDNNQKEVTIAIINTYLAVADDDYDDRDDEVPFEIWGIFEEKRGCYAKDTDEKSILDASGEDFDVADVVSGDIVRVTVADGAIQTIDDVDTLDEVTITRFTKEKSVTVDGTQYDYASTAMFDDEVLDQYDASNLKDTSYNVYLDQYGYLLGIEIVEETSQYLFVTGIEKGGNNLAASNVDANVIFLDGTMDTVQVNTTKGNPPVDDALANTWCKYTVDKNGIYTLTEIKSTTFDSDVDKVGQAKDQDNTSTDADTDPYDVTIDKKNTTLSGNGDLKVVYGNDASVYLTVGTEEITATNPSGKVIIINGVDSVTTGVRNASLKSYTAVNAVDETDDVTGSYSTADYADKVSSGVYTLFKNNGYVIAAIVVGEDDGTTSNFVYVTSKTGEDGLNMEEYDSSSEEYTWTRTVILDGEEVELTEITDTDPVIEGMIQNNWYEVKYYADGTVRSVGNALDFSVANDKYVDDITDIEDALNGRGSYGNYDTVLLFDDMTNEPYSLTSKGNTFFADNGVKSGFAVDPDAKIVLVQDKKVASSGKVTLMADVEEFNDGIDGIEKALKRMNDNSNFKGYVSAVFEDGLATSVVIYDRTETLVEDVDVDQNNEYVTNATVNVNDMQVYVRALPGATDKTAAAIKAMQDAGYTSVSVSNGRITGVMDGVTYNFGITSVNMYKATFALGTGFSGVEISSDNDVVYMAKGDEVTLTLKKTNDDVFSSVPTAAEVDADSTDSNTDAYDVTKVTGKNGDKSYTITITQNEAVTSDNTVTLSK